MQRAGHLLATIPLTSNVPHSNIDITMVTRAPEIVVPRAADARGMLELRTNLYVEELVTSGCSRQVAERHTHGWLVPDNLVSYEARVERWLADTGLFVRIVRTWSSGEPRVSGLFIASMDLDAPPNPPEHYVHSIQIHPDFQGKGLGRRLIEELAATADPVLPIGLDVLCGNLPARKFYDRMGFVAIDAGPPMCIGGEVTLESLHLQRQ